MRNQTRTIEFSNGFALTLACDGKRFVGIGEVRYGPTPLRCPAIPWTLRTESESGFSFGEFRLESVEEAGDAATVVFTARGEWMPRSQAADCIGEARIRTRRISPPEATFRWRFRVISERIQEQTWNGLAMQAEADTPGCPIHWMLEDTTWEIGGQAEGCSLIQQDVSSMDPEQFVSKDSAFSTWEHFYRRRKDGSGWDGIPLMDMMPRCAGASPLDFQVKGDLAMCVFAEKPSLTRARIDKMADEDVIHYVDHSFFPLTERAEAPERKLLVYRHPHALKRHEWRNLWLDCFTEVRRRIHANYGFTLELPRPQLYAMLWNRELNLYGKEWIEPLIAALPTYRQLGFKDIFTHGVFVGTSTDPNSKDHNICSNYEYRFAEEFGGSAAMKRLFDAMHAQGMKAWHWINPGAMDEKAPVWREHPDWIVRDSRGDPWDAGYVTARGGRMRSGYAAYMFEEMKQIKTDTGLDNFYWDSYPNLCATCVDWQAPDKAPQIEEVWRFQAALQKIGYKGQRPETVTIFGIASVQMYGFDAEIGGGMGVCRRWWSRTVKNDDVFVWMDCGPSFFSDNPYAPGRITPELYFWMVGHRAIPGFDARPWNPPSLPGGDRAGEYARVNHFYHSASPHMRRLRLVEDGGFTLWLDGANEPSVIWAFRDSSFAFTGAVRDLASKATSRAGGILALKAGHVYLLGRAAG